MQNVMKEMMKAVRIGVALIPLLMCCSCPNQEVGGLRSEEELLAKVRNGFKEKNVSMIMQLGYWEDVPDQVRKSLREHILRRFDTYMEPRCTIREMSEKEREPIRARGKSYVWNIEPVGFIVIKGRDPEYGSSDLPFGMHKGQYYIAARYPRDDR